METRMIGPGTGADARAYRQPPTAASVVPRATSTRMNVYRRGRAKDLETLNAVDYRSCSITDLAWAASADAGSTARTRSIIAAALARSPLFSEVMPICRSGLPQFGSLVEAF